MNMVLYICLLQIQNVSECFLSYGFSNLILIKKHTIIIHNCKIICISNTGETAFYKLPHYLHYSFIYGYFTNCTGIVSTLNTLNTSTDFNNVII